MVKILVLTDSVYNLTTLTISEDLGMEAGTLQYETITSPSPKISP